MKNTSLLLSIKDHQNLKEIEILFEFTKETCSVRTIYVHTIFKGFGFYFRQSRAQDENLLEGREGPSPA
jgi:hypothetical protein